jgi:hypothetical protein
LVSGGDWIAGPELPAQIEGIELRWPGKPADVDLEYVVTVGTRGAQRLPVRRTGEFAGTRGRGLPITSLAISLRGGNTLSMRLEALFLGAPAVSKKGRELSVAGPTGREPLVGLRMSMIGAQVQTTAAPKVIEPISRSHAKDQVRVFRGPRARAA